MHFNIISFNIITHSAAAAVANESMDLQKSESLAEESCSGNELFNKSLLLLSLKIVYNITLRVYLCS